ncbi:MAG: hypothetical protein KBS39_01355 [Lachnospiraceae bacterium]|nr:hypothetical protein [Candidatus Hippenecus merdae]
MSLFGNLFKKREQNDRPESEQTAADFQALRDLEMISYELEYLSSNEKIADLAIFVNNLPEQIPVSKEDGSFARLITKIINRIGETAVSLGRLGTAIAAKFLGPKKAGLTSENNRPPQNISYYDIGRIVLKDTGVAILVYLGATLLSLFFGVVVFRHKFPGLTWAIFIPSFGALATILFKICSSVYAAVQKVQTQHMLSKMNDMTEGYGLLLASFHQFEADFKSSLDACRKLLGHYYDRLKIPAEYRGIVPLFTISDYYITGKEPSVKKACAAYRKGIKRRELAADPVVIQEGPDGLSLKEEQKDLAESLEKCRENVFPVVSFSFNAPEDICLRMDAYRENVQERLAKYDDVRREMKPQKRKGLFFLR